MDFRPLSTVERNNLRTALLANGDDGKTALLTDRSTRFAGTARRLPGRRGRADDQRDPVRPRPLLTSRPARSKRFDRAGPLRGTEAAMHPDVPLTAVSTAPLCDKRWGYNRPVLEGPGRPQVAVATFTEPGEASSVHFHHGKTNLFYVLTGRCRVEVFGAVSLGPPPAEPVEAFDLDAGQRVAVPPRVWHRFRALTPRADVLEVYWAESATSDDIVRHPEGCPCPHPTTPRS
jgi:mannose-6-phosphate isomerase-like protein (cupin superfamily)